MSFSTGLKQKLKISQCDPKTLKVKEGVVFEAMINPAAYKRTSGILYAPIESLDVGSDLKFQKVMPDTYEFNELILDGTGVVALLGMKSVKEQIDNLRAVACVYDGENHEPPVVNVLWGSSLGFNARLQSLVVNYTLFKPNGEPLRAKVSLKFIDYRTNQQIIAEAQKTSPDLTHLVEVKAGDTLPNLCYRIYKDTSFCVAVARINQLSNFRYLQPGKVLRFPPLV